MSRRGYWEGAELSAEGVRLHAWAFDPDRAEPPVGFVLTWAGEQMSWPPNQHRPDVAPTHVSVDAPVGLSALARVNMDPHADWSDAALVAVFADGERMPLAPLRASSAAAVADLGFTRFDVFEERFQNPAFRVKSPLLQAYAAARALRVAGDDMDFWLAGAVVGIYRCILDECFSEDVARDVIATWGRMQGALRASAGGTRLRWATSMHLAAGYAHLAWGEFDRARDEFAAMGDYMPRLVSWPQALSNLGTGRLLAAWLTAKLSGPAAALPILDGTEDAFQAGIGPLKIWNYHMYEEARMALDTWQRCFLLKKLFEGETAAHILPPDVSLRLSQTSAVSRMLVSIGSLADQELLDLKLYT